MRRLGRDRGGWVAAGVVALLPLLLAFLGVVLDAGMLMLQGQMLDAASDAAALAATDAWDREYWKWHGRVRIDPSRARSLAAAYLHRNLPGAVLVELTVSPPNRVHLRTRMEVQFFFMRIFGHDTQTVESFSAAERRNVN